MFRLILTKPSQEKSPRMTRILLLKYLGLIGFALILIRGDHIYFHGKYHDPTKKSIHWVPFRYSRQKFYNFNPNFALQFCFKSTWCSLGNLSYFLSLCNWIIHRWTNGCTAVFSLVTSYVISISVTIVCPCNTRVSEWHSKCIHQVKFILRPPHVFFSLHWRHMNVLVAQITGNLIVCSTSCYSEQ